MVIRFVCKYHMPASASYIPVRYGYNDVRFVKIFGFLLLFVGISALPPVIRIGKYIKHIL